MSHQWFYMRSGMFKDESVGPLVQSEFLKLLQDGTLKRDTLVASPTHTKSQWIELQQIPKLLELWVKYHEQREAAKALAAEQKRQQAEVAAAQKALEAKKRNEELARQEQARQAAAEADRLNRAAYEEQQRQAAAQRQHEIELARAQAPQQFVQAPVPMVDTRPSTIVVNQSQATSPVVAALLNLFCLPGLGQLVQGRIVAAMLFAFAWIVSVVLMWVLIGFLLVPIVYIWAIVDAARWNPQATVIVTR